MAVRCLLLCAVFLVVATIHAEEAHSSVLAIIFFGDSLLDLGNNDCIHHTIFKANFPPYGRDSEGRVATGRFCNGKLLSDIIGEKLGFTSSSPPYLSVRASGQNLVKGANFASAGLGYYDPTALMYILLSQQLEYFKEYQIKLAEVAGGSQARSVISDALYILCAASNGFGPNYYINPLLFKRLTMEQFSDLIVTIVSDTPSV